MKREEFTIWTAETVQRLREGDGIALEACAFWLSEDDWPEHELARELIDALAWIEASDPEDPDDVALAAAVRCALANGDRTGLVGLGWNVSGVAR